MLTIEIPKTAKRIPDSKDWVDIDGSIYSINTKRGHDNTIFKKSQHIVHGYYYCGIYINSLSKPVSKRVNRLVAEAFIPNPNNLPIVGHKNNIKSDNRVENLYWTTVSENTQKAFDDGLIINDKGVDDSQSIPVKKYNTYTDELIEEYGSVSIASKENNISKNAIIRQAVYKKPVRKPFYFRFYDDNDVQHQTLIGMYEYDTDELKEVFINTGEASRVTGYSPKTISSQCNKNNKPTRKFNKHYFKRITR